MSVYVRTRAVVLRHDDATNVDVRITFLTATHGKLSAVARGLRLHKSKLAAQLEPLTVTEVSFVAGRVRRLVTGTNAERIHGRIRRYPARAFAAGVIVRLADLLLPFEEPDTIAFEETVDALAVLDRSVVSAVGVSFLPFLYAWKLLGRSGFSPNCTDCAACRFPLGRVAVALTARADGFVHMACIAGVDATVLPVDSKVIAGLRYFATARISDAIRLGPATLPVAGMQQVIARLIEERYEVPASGPFWSMLVAR